MRCNNSHIPKVNGKPYSLTIPSPQDKIVQAAMRFLLEMIYEPFFRESSYGLRPNKGCYIALQHIKLKCQAVS